MNHELLHEARAKVAATRDALSAAAEAVQRAQQQVADELLRIRECECDVDAARERATLDAAQFARDSAAKDHTLALRRLEDRQGEHADAELQARDAGVAVVRAVDRILGDEIAERSRQVEHHLNEALRLGTALKYFAVAAGVHSTEVISPFTLGVLDRLDLPLVSSLDVPINMAKLGDTTAFREWTARRTALIDGDGEPQPKAA